MCQCSTKRATPHQAPNRSLLADTRVIPAPYSANVMALLKHNDLETLLQQRPGCLQPRHSRTYHNNSPHAVHSQPAGGGVVKKSNG
jgi:hypothetical protein